MLGSCYKCMRPRLSSLIRLRIPLKASSTLDRIGHIPRIPSSALQPLLLEGLGCSSTIFRTAHGVFARCGQRHLLIFSRCRCRWLDHKCPFGRPPVLRISPPTEVVE